MRDGWKEISLGEIVELGKGGSWGQDDQSDGLIQAVCLRGTDLAELIYKRIPDAPVRWIKESELRKSECSKDMVLIETSGSKCGRSIVLTEEILAKFDLPVIYSNFCRTLTIETKIVTREFIEIWFSYNYANGLIPSYRATSAMPNLDVKALLRVEHIRVPPLSEQKRIVDLISSVDSYIEALQQDLESAKRSRNAVLHELLTAGGNDWLSGIVGDISDLRYGFTESANWDPIGPKFLRITDIQDGSVDWDSVPYCQISDSEKVAQLLEDGDLVFARTGATTGKSFLVTNPPVSVCASYLIRLRPNQSKVNPHYLSIFFQSEDYWSQVMAGTSGSAQGGVNASKLSKLKIDIPPLSTQTEISEIIQEMDNYTFGIQKAIHKSQDLRSGLLNELLSGEHEIPTSYDKVIGAA